MKRLCPVCFTEIPEKANYCPICGKCMRESVEWTKRYIGSPEETIVVGIADSAIHIGEELATSTNREVSRDAETCIITDRKEKQKPEGGH